MRCVCMYSVALHSNNRDERIHYRLAMKLIIVTRITCMMTLMYQSIKEKRKKKSNRKESQHVVPGVVMITQYTSHSASILIHLSSTLYTLCYIIQILCIFMHYYHRAFAHLAKSDAHFSKRKTSAQHLQCRRALYARKSFAAHQHRTSRANNCCLNSDSLEVTQKKSSTISSYNVASVTDILRALSLKICCLFS